MIAHLLFYGSLLFLWLMAVLAGLFVVAYIFLSIF